MRKPARSLVAAALLALTAAAPGCADENDPATWVKRLDDPTKRVASITRLVQFFEDAMTNDKGDRNGAKVKPVLDKIADPLNAQCVKGDLDEKSMAKVVKFVSDARDARGEPCLQKVLKDYKLGSGEENVRWATRAVSAMKLKSAAAPLWEVFTKMRVSNEKVGNVYRDVSDAMMALQDPSWESGLIDLLKRPIKTPDPKNKEEFSNAKDQVFWQVTSAILLGNMKSTKAVDPLIRILLTPSKSVVAIDAMNSLIKIGKPASDAAAALLKGENKDLEQYARDEALRFAGDKPDEKAKKLAKTVYVEKAAFIMATIGREDAVDVLLAAMDKAKADAGAGGAKPAAPAAPKPPAGKDKDKKDADDDSASAIQSRAAISRVLIAQQLAQLPKSEKVTKAFLATLTETPITLAMPVGASAREALLEKAADFFDPTFVPVIVKEAVDAKGEEGDLVGMREKTLEVAMKIAKSDQVAELDKLYNMKVTGPDNKPTTFGKAFENEYKLMQGLFKDCGDKGSCYLDKLLDPASHGEKKSYLGIKAAYMVGMLNFAEGKPKLVDGVQKAVNEQQRYMCLKLIDQFSPKGDKAIAEQLQKMIDSASESKDEARIANMRNVRTILYRLNARAQ